MGPILPVSSFSPHALHISGLAQAHQCGLQLERGQECASPALYILVLTISHLVSTAAVTAACCENRLLLSGDEAGAQVIPGPPYVAAESKSNQPNRLVSEHSPNEALTPSRRGTFFLHCQF